MIKKIYIYVQDKRWGRLTEKYVENAYSSNFQPYFFAVFFTI